MARKLFDESRMDEPGEEKAPEDGYDYVTHNEISLEDGCEYPTHEEIFHEDGSLENRSSKGNPTFMIPELIYNVVPDQASKSTALVTTAESAARAASNQWFREVRSPAPLHSRRILMGAIGQFAACLLSHSYNHSYPGDWFGYGLSTGTLLFSFALEGDHRALRRRYNKSNNTDLRKSYQATPCDVGFLSVCAWVIFSSATGCRAFPTILDWIVQAQIWFWMGYWVEWWTRGLANVLAFFGC